MKYKKVDIIKDLPLLSDTPMVKREVICYLNYFYSILNLNIIFSRLCLDKNYNYVVPYSILMIQKWMISKVKK
jgi:hypothetical protein